MRDAAAEHPPPVRIMAVQTVGSFLVHTKPEDVVEFLPQLLQVGVVVVVMMMMMMMMMVMLLLLLLTCAAVLVAACAVVDQRQPSGCV